jgi:uncharacterized protein
MKLFGSRFCSNSFLLFFFLLILSFPQQSNSQCVTNNLIVIGKIDSIHSKILNEERKIWVYVPNRYSDSIYEPEKFPVIYLLDGDTHFPSVMGMVQQLSEVNGNTICPNMIIVGITNTDRTRDLTPTHSNSALLHDSSFVKTSGGGEKFTDFLEKELIPHIDSLYPTAPYRMMIGHSLGGLTVINTLLNRPYLFNSYIAIDPSLWWDNHKLLDKSATIFRNQRFEGKTFFLAMANTIPPGYDTAKTRSVTPVTPQFEQAKCILEFSDILKANSKNGLRWDWKYYRDDSHGSVPLMAEYDGLHLIFDYYKFNFLPDQPNLDSVLTMHYKKVSQIMGYTVRPPELMVNGLAYDFLQQNMLDRAFRFFKMNVDNYPKSLNVYDSMGDYYNAKGEKKKAIEYYTKALEIRYYSETKQKLDKLKLGK